MDFIIKLNTATLVCSESTKLPNDEQKLHKALKASIILYIIIPCFKY
jgi:hypothetical protein